MCLKNKEKNMRKNVQENKMKGEEIVCLTLSIV